MSDLIPSELYWEILSRVPTEPLLRFRCVCTEWRQIIDDPTFIRSHVQRQAGRERVMIRTRMGRKLYTFSLEALYNFEKPIWAEPLKIVSRHGIPVLPATTCNGLILVQKKVWSLRNPYTRKSIKLPLPLLRGSGPLSGLGYDQATDDYKVVRITYFYDRNNETYTFETWIYSLKLGYWREIEDFPNCTCVEWPSKDGLFVNGALHWMSNVRLRDGTDIADEMIIAFDLGTENYRLLPLPSNLFAPNKHLADVHKDLSVLDGCLFLSCIYSNKNNTYSKFRCDGWMMKDYSSCGGIIDSSWTKLFSFIPQSEIGKGSLRFIAYLKNKGQVLIQHKYTELFWLDIENKSAKRVIIRGVLNSYTSQAFPATLVRLNDKASDGGD